MDKSSKVSQSDIEVRDFWNLEEHHIVTHKGGYEYAIPLRRMRTEADLLEWVRHMGDKRWVSKTGLMQLIDTIQRYFENERRC